MSELYNLTPHTVHVIGENGKEIDLFPEPERARVASKEEIVGHIDIEGVIVPIYSIKSRRLVGLPDPVPDRMYVVSGLVARYADRPDALAPMRTLRGEGGKVLGIRGLLRYADL